MSDRPRKPRRLPIPDWVGELRDPATLRADITAGIAVALVLIPQSMAYAQLAGLPPIYGLYAGLLPMMVAAIFGSSRLLVSGPAAVMCIMTAAALESLGLERETSTYISYALLIAALAGTFQLALGLLRMGVLVDFISHPVVSGFTNAAALIIATSQVPKLFRIDIGGASRFMDKVAMILMQAIRTTHLPTLAMSALTFAVLVGVKRWKPKFPAVLAAVAVATVVSWLTGFAAAGGYVVGDIPKGLPAFRLPAFERKAVLQLIGPSVTIALVGIMSAISIAKVIAARTRETFDPNRELIGQALGNLTASVFQGCVVAGSFARSAVNWKSGARTPFSSVVTGIVVALTLLFFTPLLYHMPQAALGAVTINAVTRLIQLQPILRAWRAHRHCAIVAIVTFLTTLLMAPKLEIGMLVGVSLSIVLYLSRAMRPRFVELGTHPNGTMRGADDHGLTTCPYVAVCRFDGSLFFANVGYFETHVLRLLAERPHLRHLVVDAEGINDIDASGVDAIDSLATQLSEQGIQLHIARAKQQLIATFERTGTIDRVGRDHFWARSLDAFRAAKKELSANCSGPCPEHGDELSVTGDRQTCPHGAHAAAGNGQLGHPPTPC
jgi:SulP family sulfate permease